ncbi:MAG: YaiI/YqxD family protein [Myxococcales bacterium]
MPLRLWVDADACPREVKDLVYRAAERFAVPTVLVANSALSIPRLAHVSTVRVGKGLDVADAHIAREAAAGDVAVTADVPLAAILVRKGVVVIDPRGETYSPDTIEERLAMRDLLQELRDSGVPTQGPKPFDARARQQIANALDRVLTAARRRAP